MTADQYVESVKQMMNQQTVFFTVFLVIIGFVLGFIGILQWRLSSKQIEKIIESTKQDTKKELLNSLKIQSFDELPKAINSKIEIELEIQKDEIKELKNKLFKEESSRFSYDTQGLFVKENVFYHFQMILNIYEDFISSSDSNLNMFIDRLDGYLSLNNSVGTVFDRTDQATFLRIIEKLRIIADNNDLNQYIIDKFESSTNKLYFKNIKK